MIQAHRRKPNRIPDFDYSQNYAYFLTICTSDKRCLFGRVVNSDDQVPQVQLSEAGRIADQAIRAIPTHYPTVHLENYVVMPNHIHILLRLDNRDDQKSVSVSTVVQQFKGYVTKQIGKQIWQKLYHDHVIRDSDDFAVRWRYIENNPYRWLEDKYYSAE